VPVGTGGAGWGLDGVEVGPDPPDGVDGREPPDVDVDVDEPEDVELVEPDGEEEDDDVPDEDDEVEDEELDVELLLVGGGTVWSPCPFPPAGRPKYAPVSGS
jgi:hypothetical protein